MGVLSWGPWGPVQSQFLEKGQIREEIWSLQSGTPMDLCYNQWSQGGTAEKWPQPGPGSEGLQGSRVGSEGWRTVESISGQPPALGPEVRRWACEKDVSWGADGAKSVGRLVEDIIDRGWPGPATLDTRLGLAEPAPRERLMKAGPRL